MNTSYTNSSRKFSRFVFGFLWGIIIIFSTMQAVAAQASAEDVHELADVCMLAQRLLKDYALVGMGVTYHDPAADLIVNTKLIDKYILDIENHHLKKELDDEIRLIEAHWKVIEPKLLEKPDKTKMTELHKLVEKFTKECEAVTEHLSQDTGIEGEHYVVLISELGMESQRLAALYMMKAWGVADPNYYEEVQEVLDEYEEIYKELMDADVKYVSAEIKAALKTTEDHFRVFEFMAASKSGRFVPTMAEKSATKIFNELRNILILEEKLIE